MAHDVFISHATQDKATGDAICAALEKRGIGCWIAPRNISPGKEWGESIIDAIHDCAVFILVYSSAANQSPQIKREVERAASQGIPILPFRIENVPLSKTLEYFISTPHWLDAFQPPLAPHLQRLGDAVELLLKERREVAGGKSQVATPGRDPQDTDRYRDRQGAAGQCNELRSLHAHCLTFSSQCLRIRGDDQQK